MTGTCRFCGCTELRACDGGCWWVDRQQTVCSDCVDVDKAWRAAAFSRTPSMTLAFGRGFKAGESLTRVGANPYGVGGRAWRFWYRGYDAGGGRSSAIGTPVRRRA